MLSAMHVGEEWHVIPPGSITGQRDASTGDGSSGHRAEHLLIVEPEALVRWSLVTYLGKWFVVYSADSRTSADRVLDDHRIDALVVSDDLSDRAAEDIEAHARSKNSSVRVVRTVTNPSDGEEAVLDTPCVEKPFELSKLASLLGVGDAPVSGE
ncbi:MAG: hypothetical protein JSU86_11720 [Phycisphaerales bacterium]|nr:MAG: hypothetical protein JSU86_11720 [Phycisphaerales bacterium]